MKTAVRMYPASSHRQNSHSFGVNHDRCLRPMNALRLAQCTHALSRAAGTSQLRRASTISVVSHSSSLSALPLSNVEAQWEKLSKEEQVGVYRQLEELQKKDWKSLTIDEKKAGAFSTLSHTYAVH